MTPIGTELDGFVLAEIKNACQARKIRKTKDCLNDMDKAELFESDVEKVIMDADAIEKAMPATSERASHPDNSHDVIHGTSTRGVSVYRKVCSNYHSQTGAFSEWKRTSFTRK